MVGRSVHPRIRLGSSNILVVPDLVPRIRDLASPESLIEVAGGDLLVAVLGYKHSGRNVGRHVRGQLNIEALKLVAITFSELMKELHEEVAQSGLSFGLEDTHQEVKVISDELLDILFRAERLMRERTPGSNFTESDAEERQTGI